MFIQQSEKALTFSRWILLLVFPVKDLNEVNFIYIFICANTYPLKYGWIIFYILFLVNLILELKLGCWTEYDAID